MDLGQALMDYGVAKDWKNPETDPRPSFIRQQDWIPCGCNKCFFCRNGMTHGVAHKVKGQKRKTSSKARPKCPKDRVKLSGGRPLHEGAQGSKQRQENESDRAS